MHSMILEPNVQKNFLNELVRRVAVSGGADKENNLEPPCSSKGSNACKRHYVGLHFRDNETEADRMFGSWGERTKLN